MKEELDFTGEFYEKVKRKSLNMRESLQRERLVKFANENYTTPSNKQSTVPKQNADLASMLTLVQAGLEKQRRPTDLAKKQRLEKV